MSDSPAPPRSRKQPLFFALRAFLRKEGGHVRNNPWTYAFKLYKPLKLERKLIAGWPAFSTGCGVFSTGLPIFSTGGVFGYTSYLSIYLSIFKGRRRIKEGGKAETRIHGLAELPIFSSTGF